MIRVDSETKTAYVSTVSEALRASALSGVEDVVIEDNEERLKMQHLLKGFRL